MKIKRLLAWILGVWGTVSSGWGAVDRAVRLEVVGTSTHLQVSWTPRSALPGEYRLFPAYQLEVSTNLLDWVAVGPGVPQRWGGEAVPVVRTIAHPPAGARLFVRVVDRLQLEKNSFFQLIGLNEVVDLSGADLRGAWMDDVLLGGGFLFDGADLSGATIRRASVGYARWRGVNLTGASVVEANFYGTDLTGANFTGADARGAVFGAALVSNLNLENANLRDARAFDETAPGLRFWNTILPDGTLRTDDSGGLPREQPTDHSRPGG